jgi:hypothetical protein
MLMILKANKGKVFMKTKITSIYNKAKEAALDVTRRASVFTVAPTEAQARTVLFTVGVLALGIGLSGDLFAQGAGGSGAFARNNDIYDRQIAQSVNVLFKYIEGSFGALIMAASGIGAIMSAAFGQYKMALSCMVVAVGAFILRSMMNTFFNVESIISEGGSLDGDF